MLLFRFHSSARARCALLHSKLQYCGTGHVWPSPHGRLSPHDPSAQTPLR